MPNVKFPPTQDYEDENKTCKELIQNKFPIKQISYIDLHVNAK